MTLVVVAMMMMVWCYGLCFIVRPMVRLSWLLFVPLVLFAVVCTSIFVWLFKRVGCVYANEGHWRKA
jgi:hypothetical protein